MDANVMMYNRFRRFLISLFLTYLAVVIYATLFTYNYYIYGKSINLIAFKSIKLMFSSGNPLLILKNVIGNIILFVPFGWFLPFIFRIFRSFLMVFFTGFIFSVVIEACQFYFAERIFDVDDILLNTVGTGIGYVFYRIIYLTYIIVKRHIK